MKVTRFYSGFKVELDGHWISFEIDEEISLHTTCTGKQLQEILLHVFGVYVNKRFAQKSRFKKHLEPPGPLYYYSRPVYSRNLIQAVDAFQEIMEVI